MKVDLTSRELTYPTLGKGQMIFKGALVGDMLVLIGGYIVGGFFFQHIWKNMKINIGREYFSPPVISIRATWKLSHLWMILFWIKKITGPITCGQNPPVGYMKKQLLDPSTGNSCLINYLTSWWLSRPIEKIWVIFGNHVPQVSGICFFFGLSKHRIKVFGLSVAECTASFRCKHR